MAFEVKQSRKREKITYEPRQQRFTYDVHFDNGEKYSNMNFDSKENALAWIEQGKKSGYFAIKDSKQIIIVPRKSENYKLGDMWRDDFDYTGMVKTGANVDSSWSVKKLQKLFDSYEDVNYHSASEHLWIAIQEKKKGNENKTQEELEKFRNEQKSMLKRWGE